MDPPQLRGRGSQEDVPAHVPTAASLWQAVSGSSSLEILPKEEETDGMSARCQQRALFLEDRNNIRVLNMLNSYLKVAYLLNIVVVYYFTRTIKTDNLNINLKIYTFISHCMNNTNLKYIFG